MSQWINAVFFIAVSLMCYILASVILEGRRYAKYDYRKQYEKAHKTLSMQKVKKSSLETLLEGIETVLLRSGIADKLKITAKGYLLISLAIFLCAFLYFIKIGFAAALIYSLAITYLPYSVLMIMVEINTRKIKKMYLNFLNTFDGFYNVEENVINALKATSDYVDEPLRSILKKNVTIFERTLQSTDDCLDRIMKEIGAKEFRKFLKFAKLHAKFGGNFNKAITKLREQGEKMASIESVKAASAFVGSGIILLMIFLNVIMILNLSRSPELVEVLKNTATGQVIAISNGVSIIFALYMIRHINKTA